jgi:hypothetical protein
MNAIFNSDRNKTSEKDVLEQEYCEEEDESYEEEPTAGRNPQPK